MYYHQPYSTGLNVIQYNAVVTNNNHCEKRMVVAFLLITHNRKHLMGGHKAGGHHQTYYGSYKFVSFFFCWIKVDNGEQQA